MTEALFAVVDWLWQGLTLLPFAIGFSFGAKPGKQQQESLSATLFPGRFNETFAQNFGPPITIYDIMPEQRRGNVPANFPGYSYDRQVSQRPRPGVPSTTANRPPARPVASRPSEPSVPVTVPGSTPGANFESTSSGFFGTLADQVRSAAEAKSRDAGALGKRIQPGVEFIEGSNINPVYPPKEQPIQTAIPRLQNPETLFDARTEAQTNALGFGRAPAGYSAPGAVTTERISAPEFDAAQIAIPRGSLDEYEAAIYGSQFRPVSREIGREQELRDRQLNAQLSATGLGASGAGAGLRRDQALEFGERRTAASQQAADAATQARFTVEYDNAVQNAQLRQQANLERAGLNLQAQTNQAANVLQGNLANAENYLATLGLNQHQAEEARSSFLDLVGLRGADLERMDAQQRSNIELLMNTWLQQYGANVDAGRIAVGGGSSVGPRAPISVLGGSLVQA